jgi:hypothetical protein
LTRIERRLLKWGREQQRDVVPRADQLAFDGGHGMLRALRVGRTRNRRPGLRNRINPAFFSGRRAKHGAIIEPGTPIPCAVPGLTFQRGLQRGGMRPPCRGMRRIAAGIGQLCECAECGVQ